MYSAITEKIDSFLSCLWLPFVAQVGHALEGVHEKEGGQPERVDLHFAGTNFPNLVAHSLCDVLFSAYAFSIRCPVLPPFTISLRVPDLT